MPKLGLYSFSEELVRSKDLDPVYIALWEARLEPDALKRWLLAYWCFYHCGTASWIVDRPDYWQAMRTAAGSKDYPRSRERRHFRRRNAEISVDWLSQKKIWPDLLDLSNRGPLELSTVLGRVKKWVGFGPWIAFKVADMLERLDICSISFDSAPVSLFDSPRKGAEEAWERYCETEPKELATAWALESVSTYLASSLTRDNGRRGYLAPPRYERLCGYQEAETCLCKWHSYLGGHYRLGEDIEALRKSLDFERGGTAERLDAGARAGGLW